MYAIVETGGKQYRLSPGDEIKVEKLEGEVGQEVVLDRVLFVRTDDDVKIGKPYVKGAAVVGEISTQGRARKILVFKKKRRKGYTNLRGHRQPFTALKITEIRL